METLTLDVLCTEQKMPTTELSRVNVFLITKLRGWNTRWVRGDLSNSAALSSSQLTAQKQSPKQNNFMKHGLSWGDNSMAVQVSKKLRDF
jgi:hypothetical protein